MNESLSFSHDFVSISWCMASVFLSVYLSLFAWVMRGLWGEERRAKTMAKPSLCYWNMDLSQRLWLINESGLFKPAFSWLLQLTLFDREGRRERARPCVLCMHACA